MDKTLFVRLRITGKKCVIFPIRAAAWQSFDARPKGFDDWAVLAQQAGFDGAALDASAYLPSQPTRPLLDIVQDIIAVWGLERVGVQLGPFAWMGRLEDLQWASFSCRLID